MFEKGFTCSISGYFTVIFNPKLVREILLKNGVMFSETQSLPILVIPVLKQMRLSIVENTQSVDECMEESLYDNGLIPFIIPEGDLRT